MKHENGSIVCSHAGDLTLRRKAIMLVVRSVKSRMRMEQIAMPTALKLGREGWKPYLEAARSRPAPPELTPTQRREREQLLDRIREAAAELKARFGARRVVLFGSLAHAAWFTLDSDVDIAVEGLASEDYWDAWRLVEEVVGDRPVDFVEIETVRESLRRAIERYGEEL